MEQRRAWSQVGWSILLGVASLALGILLISLAWQVIEPRVSGTAAVAPLPQDTGGGIVLVEVRNGAGTPGLAGEVTTHLRSQGFDVKEFGDWTSFDVENTMILDRIGDPGSAARVARALGLDATAIIENLDTRPLVDVTVVIGHDHPELILNPNRHRR